MQTVEAMTELTSDLGRGRAFLMLSLNERCLGDYLKVMIVMTVVTPETVSCWQRDRAI